MNSWRSQVSKATYLFEVMALLFTPVPVIPSVSPPKSVKQAQSQTQLSFAFARSSSSSSMASSDLRHQLDNTQKPPILLFDIMDTVVRDPFYKDIPAFFNMTFGELIKSKHSTIWIDFEKGLIDEMELARLFFKDGRSIDLDGLKDCIRHGYSYLDGVESLLSKLKQNNYEIHAFTNYPIWYTIIEDKLQVSKYMSWTFCSCKTGKRKPDADCYLDVLSHLEVEPERCIFVDDRLENIEAARNAGFVALQFKDAASLELELSQIGVDTSFSA